MFFTVMTSKRKLRQSLSDILNGRALAAWLNGKDVQGLTAMTARMIASYLAKECSSTGREQAAAWLNAVSPTADLECFPHAQDADYQDPIKWTSQIIGMYVAYEQAAIEYGVLPGDLIRTAFSLGFMGQMLPEEASKGSPVSPEELQERYRKGSYSPVRLRAEFRPWGRGIEFRLVPEDEHSTMLYHFIQLINSGNVSRLRFCQNCHKFWYCVGRSDQRACSVNCKVSLWQKTPAGRAKRTAYMRKHRATLRKLDSKYTKNDLTGERRKESRRARKLG
jgi:hypothetical protein